HGAADVVLDFRHATRAEKPQPIADDGTAEGRVDLPVALDLARRHDAAVAQLLIDVVALKAGARAAGQGWSWGRIATVAPNHGHAHAAGRLLRGPRRGIDDDLLHHSGIGGEGADRCALRLHREPVDHAAHVVATAAVYRQRLLDLAGIAADILPLAAEGRRQ